MTSFDIVNKLFTFISQSNTKTFKVMYTYGTSSERKAQAEKQFYLNCTPSTPSRLSTPSKEWGVIPNWVKEGLSLTFPYNKIAFDWLIENEQDMFYTRQVISKEQFLKIKPYLKSENIKRWKSDMTDMAYCVKQYRDGTFLVQLCDKSDLIDCSNNRGHNSLNKVDQHNPEIDMLSIYYEDNYTLYSL